MPARRYRTIALVSSTIDTRKCAITKPGLSSKSTVSPPSTAWAKTSADEAPRQPHQVAPPGRAHEAAEHRDDHRDRHQAGEHPVHELDHRVVVRRRVRGEPAFLAVGPRRAAEPRVGEPHGGAGDDDDRQHQRRHERDPAVRLGAQRDAPHGDASLEGGAFGQQVERAPREVAARSPRPTRWIAWYAWSASRCARAQIRARQRRRHHARASSARCLEVPDRRREPDHEVAPAASEEWCSRPRRPAGRLHHIGVRGPGAVDEGRPDLGQVRRRCTRRGTHR